MPPPPPGYQAYDAGPSPLARLSRVRGLSKASMILVGISGLSGLFSAFALAGVGDAARDFLDGRITEDEFVDDYSPAIGLQSLQGFATLAAGVVTIIWMYRIAANLRAYQRGTVWAPLFAVFGWVLPPVLVIIPFLMLREMWKASAKTAAAPTGQGGWKSEPTPPVLWAWFAAYAVVPTILFFVQASSTVGTMFSTDADQLAETLADSANLSIVSAVVSAIAAVLWIVFVRQLTARHTALTDER